jgi:hypothetical protein
MNVALIIVGGGNSPMPRSIALLFLLAGTANISLGVFKRRFFWDEYRVFPPTRPMPNWLGRVLGISTGLLLFSVGLYCLLSKRGT